MRCCIEADEDVIVIVGFEGSVTDEEKSQKCRQELMLLIPRRWNPFVTNINHDVMSNTKRPGSLVGVLFFVRDWLDT